MYTVYVHTRDKEITSTHDTLYLAMREAQKGEYASHVHEVYVYHGGSLVHLWRAPDTDTENPFAVTDDADTVTDDLDTS